MYRKSDPDAKVIPKPGLVSKIDNTAVMILTLVFIVLSYFTLRFYRRNFFCSILEEEIVLQPFLEK